MTNPKADVLKVRTKRFALDVLSFIAFYKTVAQGFSPAEAAALKGCATTEKRKAL